MSFPLIMKLENISYKLLLAILCIMLAAMPALAHPINVTMEKAPTQDVVWFYLKMGVTHIIPYGFDHILFVISLCLLSTKISTILWQASAFTVAHSITLALSMQRVIVAPSQLIEPVISLSIVFVAVENIILNKLKPWRVLIVFFFGLVHGMGFASALSEVGLPRNNFFTSVIAFNLGVEIGQVAIIVLVFGLIVAPFGKRLTYKRRLVYPMSAIIAIIAAYWTIERIITL